MPNLSDLAITEKHVCSVDLCCKLSDVICHLLRKLVTVSLHKTHTTSWVADSGFLRRGRKPQEGISLLCGQFFPKMHEKDEILVWRRTDHNITISRSQEFHFGGSYAKNSSSILRPTDDESSMIWRCVLPAMSKTPQNMPERYNSLLSPTYWQVARGNNW